MSLALRQIATYQEVMTYWDIDEVYAMHEILDIQADLEAEELAKMKAKTGARK
jgi:hypothetical protein